MRKLLFTVGLAITAAIGSLAMSSEAHAGWGRTRVYYAPQPAAVVTNHVVVPTTTYYTPAPVVAAPAVTTYYAPTTTYYAPAPAVRGRLVAPPGTLVVPASALAPAPAVVAPAVRYRPVITTPGYVWP